MKCISCAIPCVKEELDLGVTLKGGQSFRWVSCKDDEKSFQGVFSQTVWTLTQNDHQITYTVHGSLNEELNYDKVLYKYFRLNVSLREHLKTWSHADPHFENSCDKIGAVRMLDQDVTENLFSFICSSNNNIARISGMVEKLCTIFGEKICTVEGRVYHDFPTIQALAGANVEDILRKEGFGYRARYIAKSAQKLLTLGGKEWLLKLCKDSGAIYEDARENLMSLPGIGPKVADCICLMSLGHLEAIPVDTHIFQVACANYMPHLSKQKTVSPKIHQEVSSHLRDLWGPLAGWAQTVVFCVKINSVDSRKNKKRSSSEIDKTVHVEGQKSKQRK
ncbi:hypothetical protein QAD02_016990 [Eretmocerus hayati]|uniref:Uncharacterized protein n=1 Tax=Eretmocerus hayati TaxID=131215 RepID=A0ACC2PCN2_9HYME|nr:hypothetical protein QAD02_016990 [Eretmocerus hayati]